MALCSNTENLHFKLKSESKIIVKANVTMTLVSYSTLVDDIKLVDVKNELFYENDFKDFDTTMSCKCLNTIENYQAFYKDNLLRVKVKITVKQY